MSAVPPLAAYEEWLNTRAGQARARTSMTAANYRRIAVMRRDGENFAAIARFIGRTKNMAHDAYERLPEALR